MTLGKSCLGLSSGTCLPPCLRPGSSYTHFCHLQVIVTLLTSLALCPGRTAFAAQRSALRLCLLSIRGHAEGRGGHWAVS